MADRKIIWFALVMGGATLAACAPKICENPTGVCHSLDARSQRVDVTWNAVPNMKYTEVFHDNGEGLLSPKLKTTARELRFRLTNSVANWEGTEDVTEGRGTKGDINGFLSLDKRHRVFIRRCAEKCEDFRLAFDISEHVFARLARQTQ